VTTSVCSSLPIRVGRVVAAGLACTLLAACTTQPRGVAAPGAQWELVSTAGTSFGEGVVAGPDGSIYVLDAHRNMKPNPGGTIFRIDPKTGQAVKLLEPNGLALGLHVDRNGDLLIAQGAEPEGGRALVKRDMRSGALTVLVDRYQGKRLVGANDVTTDGAGRIYFTDARYGGEEPMENPNAVYRLDPDGRLSRISTDILRPNGIEVSPDSRRLYVAAANIPRLKPNPVGPAVDGFGITMGGVVVYDLDAAGNPSNGRLFYRNDRLIVDGMGMDADGNLYLALHNGAAPPRTGDVIVLDPTGRQIAHLPPPPGDLPTNLGFGRGEDRHSLYMVTGFGWKLYRMKTVREGLVRP
jgi:gluconolactonase